MANLLAHRGHSGNRYGEQGGSFERIREAAFAIWEVTTDEEGDEAFRRANNRLIAAVKEYTRQAVIRLTQWQRKGGRMRWAGTTQEQRSEAARRLNRIRWDRRPSKLG